MFVSGRISLTFNGVLNGILEFRTLSTNGRFRKRIFEKDEIE